ncbi:hypothetical protein PG985_001580 [Apiospora marii]|uniref:uncharacterized protein n=1 Tax=Apiospora marii TaxID=335849 RepID=UPI00313014FC
MAEPPEQAPTPAPDEPAAPAQPEAPAHTDDASKSLVAMKLASETVRNAIISAIPVANNQILTVSVPGTMINYKDFLYNADETIKAPLAVRVAEARLVDNMIPLSKFTNGPVARSYLSTLDFMVPVEASVSGAIGYDPSTIMDERLKTVRDRYNKAMDTLKSHDESAGLLALGRSKLETYVIKQEIWSKEVEKYSHAQNAALAHVQPPPGASTRQVQDARELYLQWMQEHGRDYMDWVVHGYKFMIDFNFGIVDISSGVKRIENSKEAFRNLSLIADDGVSEYNSVILTPSHWATIIKEKIENWDQRNNKPTASERRAELRRLRNLLASHEVLLKGVEEKALFPVIAERKAADEGGLRKAYAAVYADMDDKANAKLKGPPPGETERKGFLDHYKPAGDGGAEPSGGEGAAEEAKGQDAFRKLAEAQAKWNETSLDRNNAAVRSDAESHVKEAQQWLTRRIDIIKGDIEELEKELGGGSGRIMPIEVVNEKGVVVEEEALQASPGERPFTAACSLCNSISLTDATHAELVGRPVPVKASEWTRVSCKAARSSESKESFTHEQASSIAAKVGYGFVSAGGGVGHANSSAKAMSSMANLDVEITMDTMVVEIDRPWLHEDLFYDAELDSGKNETYSLCAFHPSRFDISPGPAELKRLYEADETPKGPYQQFSSYPTAFVVAADVELSFSGDTTQLESAVTASSTEANLSVGYGPFSLSGSHKQSDSHAKTKMEATATGCHISIQAPQIVAWVQTLLPQLLKPTKGENPMAGLFSARAPVRTSDEHASHKYLPFLFAHTWASTVRHICSLDTMHLFDLPPELVGPVFEIIAGSRELKRFMRLRILLLFSHRCAHTGMFRHYIDDVIFRLQLLHRIPKSPSKEWILAPRREPTHTEACSLVFRYLAYQAWIETEPNSLLGRVRRAAVSISEQLDDAGLPAVMSRLGSLCRLAASNENGPGIPWMLFWSEDPDEIRFHDGRWSITCSDQDLEDDLCVAAAYLGYRSHIQKVVAQRRLLCPWGPTSQVTSRVFGRTYDAAVMSGDMSMLRLLLSSSPSYVPDKPLHRNVRRTTLELAAIFGHREAYEFALGSKPDSMRTSVEDVLQELQYPDQYDRALSILHANPFSRGIELLSRKARHGHGEMVKYLLDQGISPNHEHGKEEGPFCRPYKPLIQAVEKGNPDIVDLLLERGADPNWFHPTNTPLMTAARLSRHDIAVALLVGGADVDTGCPPPIVLAVLKEDMDMFRLLRGRFGARLDTPETGGWAMALARLHGLESMVEVLEGEGVGRDVVLHRCGRFEELYPDLYLYAWPPVEF